MSGFPVRRLPASGRTGPVPPSDVDYLGLVATSPTQTADQLSVQAGGRALVVSLRPLPVRLIDSRR